MDAAVAKAKPSQVLRATYLLWASLFLSFVERVLDSGSLGSQFWYGIFNGGYILVVLLSAYFITGIANGRNSARFFLLVWVVISLILTPPNLGGFVDEPVFATVEVVQISMQALAFFWIFTSPGKSWYVANKSAV